MQHLVRLLIALAAVVLAAASLAMNADFWRLTLKGQEFAQWAAVGVSIAFGVLKVCMPAYMLRNQIPKLSTAGAFFLCVFVFELLIGVAYARMTRGEVTSIDRAAVKDRAELERRLADKIAARDGIPKQRPARVVRAELDDAQSLAGARSANCLDGQQTEACKKVRPLRVEFATAEARETLQAEVDALAAKLAAAPEARETEPHVAAIITHVQSFGWHPDPHVFGVWFAFVWVLLLEVGAVVAATAAFTPSRKPEPPAAPIAHQVPRKTRGAGGPVPVTLLDTLKAADAGRVKLPGVVRVAPAELQINRAELALALKLSKSTLGRRLDDLETGGRITTASGKNGTTLHLMYP